MIKTTCRKLKYSLQGNSVYWSNGVIRNWGDDINPWLYLKITGKEAVYCPHQDVPRLLMIGSILDRAGASDSCWGTGFISDSPIENRIKLRKAYATRGPLTAHILEKSGVSVNHVYGDPGVIAVRCIMSELGSVEKHNRIGIIPHYVDVEAAHSLALEMKVDTKIVPVNLPRMAFVAEILKCSYVLSSSLHGLVVAESLGIPSAWLCISDKVIGGSFKFKDYILGTDRQLSDLIKYDAQYLCQITSLKQINALPLFDSREVANRLLSAFPRKSILQVDSE
jgi:pyruvyltransferase